jgi:ABC-type xylose transport system permease subunit
VPNGAPASLPPAEKAGTSSMRENEGTVPTGSRAVAIPKMPALLATAALVLIGLGILFVNTYEMMPSLLPGYPGDAFFPRLIIGFTAIFAALILFAGGWRYRHDRASADDSTQETSLDWIETAIVSILALAYVVLLNPLGFELTTTAFLALLLAPRLLMPMTRAIPIAIVSAAAATFVLYLVFVLWLNVSVSLLFLPRYLG